MGYSTKKLDLTGQHYGRLTVLEPAENIGGRTACLCRCQCGKQVKVKTAHLRSGHTKSCGCMEKGPSYVDGTSAEMLRAAKKARKNNTNGVPGVDWRPSKGVWRAAICFKGKRYYLGGYSSFEEAVAARKKAERELYDSFLKQYEEEKG